MKQSDSTWRTPKAEEGALALSSSAPFESNAPSSSAPDMSNVSSSAPSLSSGSSNSNATSEKGSKSAKDVISSAPLHESSNASGGVVSTPVSAIMAMDAHKIWMKNEQ
jgi:hypothetical protein